MLGLSYDEVYPDTAHVFQLYIQLVLVGGEQAFLGGQENSDQLHFDVQFFMSFQPVYNSNSTILDIELTPEQLLQLQVNLLNQLLE